jgi:hypothetical protein
VKETGSEEIDSVRMGVGGFGLGGVIFVIGRVGLTEF